MALLAAIGSALTSVGAWFGGLGAIGQFAVRMAVSIGFNALADALRGKPKPPEARGIVGQVQQGADVPRSFIVGRYATAGSLAFHTEWGEAGDVPNAYYSQIVALSDIPVDGLVAIWVNGQKCALDTGNPDPGGKGYPVIQLAKTFDQTDWAQVYDAPSDTYRWTATETTPTEDRAWIKFYDGTQTVADSFATGTLSSTERPWPSSAVGTGVAYAIATFLRDPEVFQSFPSVIYEIDGVAMYDPDSALTETSRNPIVAARHILAGISYGGEWFYGPQATGAGRLRDAELIAEVQACNADVPGAAAMTSAEKIAAFGVDAIPERYRCGLEVRVNRQPADVLGDILAACNGRFAEIGPAFRIAVGDPAAADLTFTDDDIISTEPETFRPFVGLAQTINGASASYPEPDEAWQTQTAPPYYVADLEVEDGGRRLLTDVGLAAVPYREQVQRLLKSAVEEARRERTHTLVMPPAFSPLEPLDYVEWTSAANGYAAKRFRVDGASPLPNGNVVLEISEVDPADYDWDANADFQPVASGSIAPLPLAPRTVAGWAVVAQSIQDDGAGERRAGLALSWTASAAGVDGVQYEIRVKATGALITHGAVGIGGGVKLVSEGILGAVTYQARARYLVSSGAPVDWTAWTDVITPDLRIAAADLDDGAVTTPRLASNAANTPLSETLSNSIAGDGTWQEIQWLNLTLPYDGEILVQWSGRHSYTAGAQAHDIEIRVDGVAVQARGGTAINDYPTILYSGAYTAGTRRISIYWKTSWQVTVSGRTLSIQGIMR